MPQHKIESEAPDKRRVNQGRTVVWLAVLSVLPVILNMEILPDLFQLTAAGAVAGLVGFVLCKLTRRSARGAAIFYLWAGFFIGDIAWTFKTSLWAGESNARRIGHLPLDQTDKLWCYLYDHYLALAAGAAVSVFLLGELSRGILQMARRFLLQDGNADISAHKWQGPKHPPRAAS